MQKIPATSGVKRVALVLPAARVLGGTAGTLLSEIRDRRHRALVLAPDWSDATRAAAAAFGAETEAFPLKGEGPRAFADFATVHVLARRLEEFNPHAVAGFGAKAALLAALAARGLNNAEVISIIGAGDAMFGPPGADAGNAARPDARWQRLARRGFAASGGIVVASEEARRRLRSLDLADRASPITTLPSSGVDLAAFAASPLPPLDDGPVFLLIERAGDGEAAARFEDAAARIRAEAAPSRFHALPSAGAATEPPPAPPRPGRTVRQRHVERLDAATELASAVTAAHVVVIASAADGFPPGALEALALARPLVIADGAFAREIVDDRVNGCLFSGTEPAALADAMAVFVRRPDLIAAMGRASRLKAERRFDERRIAADLLGLLGVARAA